jgi:hypothetical protein
MSTGATDASDVRNQRQASRGGVPRRVSLRSPRERMNLETVVVTLIGASVYNVIF